ncbi:MAG: PfkB family carbohydrate kinase [Candidatus Bathyarchaeota archaeon]|nr:PfkB family carbohydrate kinase [Candidatus Bathyarchaeota archaeon]
MVLQNIDVAIAGHFAIDNIKLPCNNASLASLGGSVAYSSLIVKFLGGAAAVISKIGEDFPEEYLELLEQKGVDLTGVIKVADAKTTRFELEYSSNLSSRTLRLKAKAPPITLSDLPEGLQAKTIQIAPIAGEISREVVEHLRLCGEVLALDPQGMLRRFDSEGNVVLHSSVDRNLLTLIDVYKSSAEEIVASTGLSDIKAAINAVHDVGVKIVFVTMGEKGALLSTENTVFQIPVYRCRRYVDPTGAGDVFMGAFLTEFSRKKELLWCASVGSAAASLVVENVGTNIAGTKEELYQRAHSLYEKEIKQGTTL